jgi:hypothetical protein
MLADMTTAKERHGTVNYQQPSCFMVVVFCNYNNASIDEYQSAVNL